MDEDRHSTRSSTTTTLSSKLKRQPTNPQPFDIQKLKQKLPLIKKEIENVTMMKHMIEINLLDSVINCNLPNVRHQLENGSSISARKRVASRKQTGFVKNLCRATPQPKLI